MDIGRFSTELLAALALVESVDRVSLQTEGPVVQGRVYFRPDLFLEVFFNQVTGTTAFALIREQARIWGIDHDALRGWHRHPQGASFQHVPISPPEISAIVAEVSMVVGELER